MTQLEQAVETLAAEPRLDLYIARLQALLREEQEHREIFHRNLEQYEGRKVEFIHGDLIEAMPVKQEHNDITGNLLELLRRFVKLHALGLVGFEKLMISLSRNDYEPDICFWGSTKSDLFTKKQMRFPAPDFVAEVLSPSTAKRDRGVKFKDYAASGVAEYWIIDPDAEVIEQYVLDGDDYALHAKLGKGLIASIAVQGFEIPVRDVFDEAEHTQALRKILG